VARSGKSRGGRRGPKILLFLLLVAAAVAAWAWWTLQNPYKGYAGAEQLVTIAPGAGTRQILQTLQRDGVIADARLARAYLLAKGSPRLQAGQYRFHGALTTAAALGKVIKGEIVARTLTLVEGLTVDEIIDQLVRDKYGRREVFHDLMRSPRLIADLDPDAPDLEGYLFPETYSFAFNTPEPEIVETLVKTFRRRFERDVRPHLAQGPPGRSIRQVVTLASIVEKEAKASGDRPLIAAVYSNRLRLRIGLAADPTVIFALKRLGRWDGNLRKDDLRMDSPYNTYRYAGLPPGPICSPGLASLVAAAAPADVPYLYFVSRNDGTHVFAQTLAEHNRNVEIWQKKYWRDRWAAERRERGAGGR
jgi:UPF0755 protein